jgi:uncharacterized protein YjgD (DUF1641 family)
VDVRNCAVKRVTGQSLLARMAVTLHTVAAYAAAERLTDQSLLARVATHAADAEVRMAAIEKLLNVSVLADIVLNERNDLVREAALTNRELREAILREDGDATVRLVRTLVRGFKGVPAQHRSRLMGAVLPAVRYLNDPDVRKDVGGIVSMRTTWQSGSRTYGGTENFEKEGETFRCSITLERLATALTHEWETEFPSVVTDISFLAATINARDLFVAHGARFSKTLDRLSTFR